MSKEEQTKELSGMIKQIQILTREAMEFADKHSLCFSLSVGSAINVNRDIAGTYYGKSFKADEDLMYALVNRDEYCGGIFNDGDEGEMGVLSEGAWVAWQSSSEEC